MSGCCSQQCTSVLHWTGQVSQLDQRLLSQLAELQSTIGDSAQPWASVSPLFTGLAATWAGLQDEMVVLSNTNR